MNTISKKGQTFEQGAFILFVSGIFVKIIGAFFKIPLSSDYCLGDIGFGYFSSVYDIYLPLYTLASTGIPSSISRIISEYLAEKDYKNANITFEIFKKTLFIISVLGTILLLLSAFPFIKLTDKTGKTFLTYLFMCPAVLFSFFSSPLRGFFEGNRNMIPTAISNIIDAFSKIAIGFTSALITVKLTGNYALSSAVAIGGIALGTFISYLFLRFYNLKYYKNDLVYDYDKVYRKKIFIKLYKICIPIVISSFAISLIPFIDSLTVRPILANLTRTNKNITEIIRVTGISESYIYEEIPTLLYGIKSKAYTIFNLVPVFTSFIASCALPSVTSELMSGDRLSASKTVNSALKLSAFVSFPLSFGLLFMGKNIMELLFGEISSYSGGIMLSLYGFAALFAGMITVLTSLLQALGKQNKALINIVIGLFVKLLCNIIFTSVPSINIYGSVIGSIIAFGFISISNFMCLLCEKKVEINLISSVLKPFISGMFCGISAFLVSQISDSKAITILSIGVGGVVYLIFLCVFRTFKISELKELIGKNNKK